MDRLRAICLQLPAVGEKETWDILRTRIRDKIFATANDPEIIWCKASRGVRVIPGGRRRP
jgi:hypothetical protein